MNNIYDKKPANIIYNN